MSDNTTFIREYSLFLDTRGEHLTYAALSTYLNFTDELSRKEKGFLKNHLETCASCSSRLREVEEVESEKVKALPQKRQRISSPVFRYSIAAGLVVAFGTAITVYILRDRPQEQFAVQLPAPGEPLAAQILDPEKFLPNEVLDAFIERTVRSATTTRFRTPHVGDTVNVPIHFAWDAMKGPYSVTILDNKNQQVLT
ncbi:MAG: zf-HC2 domain-containing protein, partial [Terriglobia bacterium]